MPLIFSINSNPTLFLVHYDFYAHRYLQRLIISKMGGSDSKQESKTVDSSGTVNNNVVLNDPVPIMNNEIVILLWTICVIKVLELLLYVYREHYKNIKKRYANQPV